MFVNQKTQEISYAMIRIAPYVRRNELRQRIERLAFQILEEVSSELFENSVKTCSVIEAILNLGKAIYEIEPVNAKIIIGEVSSLKSALRQMIGLEEVEETPDVAGLFSKVPAVINDQPVFNQIPMDGITSENRQNNSAENGNGNGMASTIRQSAILDKIRQSANRQIQLKDLLAAFPEVSERTMRYDLQKLCGQGLVERIGNGGPGSYYSLKA